MTSRDLQGRRGVARWLPAYCAVVVLAALAVGLVATRRSSELPPSLEPVVVEAETAETRSARDGFDAAAALVDAALSRARPSDVVANDALSCLIEPHEIVDIGTSVAGVIASLPVERGERVQAGQLLAQLDTGVERAAVEVARARAEMKSEVLAAEARAALGANKRERARQLLDSQALSPQLGEEIETEAELARRELERTRDLQRIADLQLDQAIEVLERRRIRSPLDGVVVDRMAAPGERVEDEPILRIAQVDPLRVEVILPAARFGDIQPGVRASIRPEIPGDELHVAEVTVVDPIIDAASGTFRVQLELPNAGGRIPGGLHCDVRFAQLAEGP